MLLRKYCEKKIDNQKDPRDSGVPAGVCGWVVKCLQNPNRGLLSSRGPGTTEGTRVYPPLFGGGWCGVSSEPPRGVPIPPRLRQDRRDSGVSAAVWEWVVRCLQNPQRASLSPRGPGRTGGTRVYPPLCGGGCWCLLGTPTGRPYPPAAQARTEGLGCLRRSVRLGGAVPPPNHPRGAPILPWPGQDRRDSGVSAAVWGWLVWCLLGTPTGRPYPPGAQAGPEGLGCLCRCVGVDGVASPQNPHDASLSPRGRGRTGGTRVYPPLFGGGWCGVSSHPPRGIPFPPRPRQDRRDSGLSAALWGSVVRCLLKTPTGRPHPPAAQAGPEGLGFICRCVGMDGVWCLPITPTWRPYPPASQAGSEGLGCTRRCVGTEGHGTYLVPLGLTSFPRARTGPEGYERLHLWGKATLHPTDRLRNGAQGEVVCSAAVPSGRGAFAPSPPAAVVPWSASRYPLLWSPRLGHLVQGPQTPRLRKLSPGGRVTRLLQSLSSGVRPASTPVVGPRAGSSGPRTVLTPRTTSCPRGCPLLSHPTP